MEQFYSKKLKKWFGVLSTGWGDNEAEARAHCIDNGTAIEKADNVKFVAACLRSEPKFHIRSYTFESGKVRCQMLQELLIENVAPTSTGNHPVKTTKARKAKVAA